MNWEIWVINNLGVKPENILQIVRKSYKKGEATAIGI